MKNRKLFIICFFTLLVLTPIAFITSFGYDEGTLHNAFFGSVANVFMKIISFPFIILMDSIRGKPDFGVGYYVGIILNIILYSYLIQWLKSKKW